MATQTIRRALTIEHILSMDKQTGEVRDRYAVNLVTGRKMTRVAKFATEAEAARFIAHIRQQDPTLT